MSEKANLSRPSSTDSSTEMSSLSSLAASHSSNTKGRARGSVEPETAVSQSQSGVPMELQNTSSVSLTLGEDAPEEAKSTSSRSGEAPESEGTVEAREAREAREERLDSRADTDASLTGTSSGGSEKAGHSAHWEMGNREATEQDIASEHSTVHDDVKESDGAEDVASLPSSAFHSMVTAQTAATTTTATHATHSPMLPPPEVREMPHNAYGTPGPSSPFDARGAATMTGRGGDDEEERANSESSEDCAEGVETASGRGGPLVGKPSSQSTRSPVAQSEDGAYGEPQDATEDGIGSEGDATNIPDVTRSAQLFTLLHSEEEGRAGLELVEAEERRCTHRAFRAILPLLRIYRADWDGLPYCDPFVFMDRERGAAPNRLRTGAAGRSITSRPHRDWREWDPDASASRLHSIPRPAEGTPAHGRFSSAPKTSQLRERSGRGETLGLHWPLLSAEAQDRPAGRFRSPVSRWSYHQSAAYDEASVSRRFPAPTSPSWAAKEDESSWLPRDRSRERRRSLGTTSSKESIHAREWNVSTNLHSLSAPSRFAEPLVAAGISRETSLTGLATSAEEHEQRGGDSYHSRFLENMPVKTTRTSARTSPRIPSAREPWCLTAASSEEPSGIAPLPPSRGFQPTAQNEDIRHSGATQRALARLPRPSALVARRFERLHALQHLMRGEIEQEWAEDLNVLAHCHVVEAMLAREKEHVRDPAPLPPRTAGTPAQEGTLWTGEQRWRELPPSPLQPPATPSALDPPMAMEAPEAQVTEQTERDRSPEPAYYSPYLHVSVNLNLTTTRAAGDGCPFPIRTGDRIAFINGEPLVSLSELQAWEATPDWVTDGGGSCGADVTLLRPGGKLTVRILRPDAVTPPKRSKTHRAKRMHW